MQNISAMQEAIEEKDSGDVMKFLAEDFSGKRQLNKQDIKRLLLVHYLRHKHINVAVSKMDVFIDPNIPFRATSEGVVLLTGASNWLPDNGRIYNVSGEWELRDGDWLLIKLDWQ